MIAQLLAAAALVAAPAPSATVCMTTSEAGDVGLVFTAEMVSGIAQACATHLPSSAFLRSEAGGSYIRRMQAGASERRAAAIAALDRVLAGRTPSGFTAEALLSSSSRPPTTAEANIPVFAAACTSISRLIEAVSPLPVENVAMAFTAIADMAIAADPLFKAEEARQRAAGRPVTDPMPDLSAFFCAR